MLQGLAECGHFQTAIGQGLGLHHQQQCVCLHCLCAQKIKAVMKAKEGYCKNYLYDVVSNILADV